MTYRKKWTIEQQTKRLTTTEYIETYSDVDRFMEFCRQCHNYQNLWKCPPYDFNPIKRIAEFQFIDIIGTKIHISNEVRLSIKTEEQLKERSHQIIESVRMGLDSNLLTLESEQEQALAFFAGSCHLCLDKECRRKTQRECRNPERARSSLEAYGFDIGKTTTGLFGWELKWGKELELPDYFLLVSGLCSNSTMRVVSGNSGNLTWSD